MSVKYSGHHIPAFLFHAHHVTSVANRDHVVLKIVCQL